MLLLVLAMPAGARPPAPPEPPLAQLNGADPAAIAGCAAAGQAAPTPFGCAVTRNLQAMLADPQDAKQPAPLAPPQGEPASRPYEQLRSGKLPPLVPVPTSTTPD